MFITFRVRFSNKLKILLSLLLEKWQKFDEYEATGWPGLSESFLINLPTILATELRRNMTPHYVEASGGIVVDRV